MIRYGMGAVAVAVAVMVMVMVWCGVVWCGMYVNICISVTCTQYIICI